jgi:hypothetical protein
MMTGPELKQLRISLGEAIGRRLSVADMTKIVGLAPAKGADTWRKWEDGARPSGPVATLMSILRLACSSKRPSPDILRGAAMACQRYGIDFRGGVREYLPPPNPSSLERPSPSPSR